ncbi:MAG: serine/threonine protein kinase, partial [Actinomycetia bacterium]|nr:serine/threonine protein kinase [Actinomycetes bacterium]
MELDLGVDHFSIVTELGRGGFGSVHLGFDHTLDRWLAIKVLRSVQGVELQAAFEAEARSHSRLSRHDHVVTVHQAGFTPGENRPWIAMEYAGGGTLQDYLSGVGGGIPWNHAVGWLIPICDAVQAAHDQGILHRDIKPENILLETSGKPLLSDFGIACLVDDAEQTPIASMAHAAPEMFQGLARTEQSDVFSLGTTLYLLLVGQPPFGWSQQDRVERLDVAPSPVSDEVGAPRWLDEVLARCLAPNPGDRLGSAAEVRQMLVDGLGHRRVDLPTIPHAVLTP